MSYDQWFRIFVLMSCKVDDIAEDDEDETKPGEEISDDIAGNKLIRAPKKKAAPTAKGKGKNNKN